MKVLIIGATGHFGGRICRRLAGHPGIELVVASRSLSAASDLAGELATTQTPVEAAALDQVAPDFESQLRAIAPDIVAHTAGPYQGQDYCVARACIEAGSHYVDLADGRDFVAGFSSLDAAAKDADVLLVSGASTLPGLSSAVLDEVRERFRRIEKIETSIAPAHQTPRGLGTVSAVLSYCGKPFEVLEEGSWRTVRGWQDMRRQRYPELGTRLSGACDVPDLQLFPNRIEGLQTATFHAALEARREQIALWLMAGLTRLGLPRNWSAAVPLFRKLSDMMIGLGSDRGGMQMRVSGVDQRGQQIMLQWDLTARQNHGPEIPCVPLLVLIRQLAAGTLTLRGALPCVGLISLEDFDAEIRDLDIDWQIVERSG